MCVNVVWVIQIRGNASTLIMGVKGSGKSTFIYLRGLGLKPTKSATDGTRAYTVIDHASDDVLVTERANYTDTIGLMGWAVDDLYKLIVLLIYTGTHTHTHHTVTHGKMQYTYEIV